MHDNDSPPEINNSDGKPTTNWRDVLPIHPACELLPKMAEAELADLAEDIRKHGMRIAPVLFAEPGPTKKSPTKYWLIDGYNRLCALERVTPFRIYTSRAGLWSLEPFEIEDGKPITVGGHLSTFFDVVEDIDPVAYVISLNINRRQLGAKGTREVIGKLLALDPSQSDRTIARLVKKSPTTVGAVRTELKANGQLSNLDSCRVGQDGRRRKPPAPKSTPSSSSTSSPPPKSSSYAAEMVPDLQRENQDLRAEIKDLRAVSAKAEKPSLPTLVATISALPDKDLTALWNAIGRERSLRTVPAHWHLTADARARDDQHVDHANGLDRTRLN